jgi:hypothetical protein
LSKVRLEALGALEICGKGTILGGHGGKRHAWVGKMHGRGGGSDV